MVVDSNEKMNEIHAATKYQRLCVLGIGGWLTIVALYGPVPLSAEPPGETPLRDEINRNNRKTSLKVPETVPLPEKLLRRKGLAVKKGPFAKDTTRPNRKNPNRKKSFRAVILRMLHDYAVEHGAETLSPPTQEHTPTGPDLSQNPSIARPLPKTPVVSAPSASGKKALSPELAMPDWKPSGLDAGDTSSEKSSSRSKDSTKKTASEAIGNEPSKTEPSKTEPSKTEPSKTEPSKTEPSKTEPSKTEPSKTEPSKTEPSKTEPSKTEPFVPSGTDSESVEGSERDALSVDNEGEDAEPESIADRLYDLNPTGDRLLGRSAQLYAGRDDNAGTLGRLTALLKDRKYSEVISQSLKVDSSAENYPRVLMVRAMAYYLDRQDDRAIETFLTLASGFPEDPEADKALLLAAKTYRRRGNSEAAVPVYSDLLRRYPNSSYIDDALYELGRIYYSDPHYRNRALAKKYFRILVTNFNEEPGKGYSPYVKSGRKYLAAIRDREY